MAGSLPGANAPMRELLLTNGKRVQVYDTSGPYSDPAAHIDIRCGLPDLRGPWLDAHGDTESDEGRQHAALDDGVKNEAEQNNTTIERIQALRAEAAGLQRTKPDELDSDAPRAQRHHKLQDGISGVH